MPKVTRSEEEIREVKETILREAVNLITETGFTHMTMRKLASRLGMTAANIYNYFGSKDELYLMIQTEGFHTMLASFKDSLESSTNPINMIRNIMKEYIRFGRENPHWYNIIFSMDTPKYADYRNTKYEAIAREEKDAGLALIDYTAAIVSSYFVKRGITEDPRMVTIKLWTTLHGVVSLLNSRVLQEVEEDTGPFIESLLEEHIARYTGD